MYDLGSKFEKYRDTANSGDFGSQWSVAREASRHRGNRGISLRLLIIILALVLVFLFIIRHGALNKWHEVKLQFVQERLGSGITVFAMFVRKLSFSKGLRSDCYYAEGTTN